MEYVADLLYDLPKNYGLVFDIVHYIVCLQGERLDMGEKFAETTKKNPLVSTKYLDFGHFHLVTLVSRVTRINVIR